MIATYGSNASSLVFSDSVKWSIKLFSGAKRKDDEHFYILSLTEKKSDIEVILIGGNKLVTKILKLPLLVINCC